MLLRSYKKHACHIQTNLWGILFSLGFLMGFAILHGGITIAGLVLKRRFWIIHNRALDPVLFTDLLQNCAVIYCCQKSPHIHIKTDSGNYSLVKGFGCLKCSLCSPKTWHTVLEGRQNVLQAAIKYAQHTNRVQILKGGMGWYSCPETEACTWHALCKQMPSGLTVTQTLGPPSTNPTEFQFLQRQYGREGFCEQMHKYSTSRDSAANAVNRTLKLSHDIVDYTQTVCQQFLDKHGYKAVNSPEELKNIVKTKPSNIFCNKSNPVHRYLQ